MKLSKLEKSLILFLLVAAIIGAGTFFFILPNLDETDRTRILIDEKRVQIDEAYQMIENNERLNATYLESVDRAVEVQKVFYPEMSVTDSIKEIQRLIAEAGHVDVSGVKVTPVKGAGLTISVYHAPSDDSLINYEIRQYSFLQRLRDAGEITGEETAEGELEITREEALRLIREGSVKGDEKRQLLDIVRNMLALERVEVGVINATFTLNLTYKEYLDFLNYINGLPQATYIGGVTFKSDADIMSPARENYGFNLSLYVIKEMDIPKTVADGLKAASIQIKQDD